MRNPPKPPSRSISDAPELDPIDRRVVAALQADGRRAFSSIADEVGVSESVVRYRVQRMEKVGILQVVGIAYPLKLGFDLMAMIGVRVQPGKVAAGKYVLTVKLDPQDKVAESNEFVHLLRVLRTNIEPDLVLHGNLLDLRSLLQVHRLAADDSLDRS